MFNNYASPFGFNTMPTATQPYGYPMNPYSNVGGTSAATPAPQAYTNLIYVSGLDDAKARPVPNGGTVIFADNDKPLIYKKTVDNKGQYEVETFSIMPYKETPKTETKDFVPRTEFEAMQKKIVSLEETVSMLIPTKKEVVTNGSETVNG